MEATSLEAFLVFLKLDHVISHLLVRLTLMNKIDFIKCQLHVNVISKYLSKLYMAQP